MFRPVRRRSGFFTKKPPKVRCPVCRHVLREADEINPDPDGRTAAVALPARPSPVELWHDDEIRCPYCSARVGLLRERFPALPAPRKRGILSRERVKALPL